MQNKLTGITFNTQVKRTHNIKFYVCNELQLHSLLHALHAYNMQQQIWVLEKGLQTESSAFQGCN